MRIEYDPAKSAINERERGLSFDLVFDLDWSKAVAYLDDRKDYGEKRVVAFVPMAGRLYVVCYTIRGAVRRIISFRKANSREVKRYEEETANR